MECLASIHAQEYPKKQLIVVDNHSSDNTRLVLRDQFPEIQVVALPSNQGVAGGRNRGIEMAHGDICIFLDDDAQFTDPQATRQTMRYFQTSHQLAGVAFCIRNFSTGVEERKAIPRIDKRRMHADYPCSYFCGAGFAMKQEIFADIGLFWEQLMYGGEELDFSYRLLDRGYHLIQSVTIAVLHREVPQARPKGQWYYCNARNRCWIAIKNLPWRYVLTTTVIWWSYLLLLGVRWRQTRPVIQGIRDALTGLPAVLRERHPIGETALQTLKKLSGRRWY